jgi:O-succinylbenzoic acid--CoA ligase
MRVLPSGAGLAVVTAAIGEALQGRGPVAPLPADPVEAERVRTMLQPEIPVSEPDAAVIVSTSGSTGTPKGVVLSGGAVAASAAATHQRLGGPGRWLLALPTHYVAGFMVVARAAVTGQSVSSVGSDLSGLADAVRSPERSYLSVVPTQLSRALDDPALTAALRKVSALLLGGAPARPALLSRARDAGLNVVTTYGMSETCGGCIYDGQPLPGVRAMLAEQADGIGRILLGGPMVFSGYRLRPELTAETLVDGVVRTNDRGCLSEGRLTVLGRFDDVIISGGMKIDLAAVERAAREWPALAGADIVLLGVPDPEWGMRLVAVAEQPGPSGAEQPDLLTLQGFLAERLARHEQPRELIMMSSLPRTSSGKVDRRSLLTDITVRRGVTDR